MQAEFGPEVGIRQGDIIAGKYRVDRILGTGGMGVVVAARHLALDELVAIKLLLPDALADADTVRRFEREARAAVKIKSEHVARIIDVGALDDGAPFIVMEYLRGEDLAARVARTGPLGVEEAIGLILQACEAMAEAHALGIVHRDLKPANLFCVRGADGQLSIKVLDFGISKFTQANASTSGFEMTKTSAVVGSPFYMSPEQMQAPRTVDERTDVWAIGIVLYQLLTGDVPFAGETLPQICVNIATRPAPPLRELRADVPIGLETVCLKCLEKDPDKRYPSVASLATALGRFGSRRAQVSVDRISITARLASLQVSEGARPWQEATSDRPVTGTVRSWTGAPNFEQERGRLGLGGAAGVGMLVVAAMGLAWAVREPAASVTAPGAILVNPSSAPTRGVRVRSLATLPQNAVATATSPPTPVPSAEPGMLKARPITIETPGGAAAAAVVSQTMPSLPPAGRAASTLEIPSPSTDTVYDTCIFNLNSIPASAVELDGISLGFTPKIGISVAPGEHKIFFVSQEGDKRATNATCLPGETKTIAARLIELPTADELPAVNPYR